MSEPAGEVGKFQEAAALTFRTPAGEAVLDHLTRITVLRDLKPGVSEAELRHLEGQRHLVLYIKRMIEAWQKRQAGL